MKTRGTIGVDILIVAGVVGVAAMLVGNWKPLKVFEKGPPVAQLEQARADADKAKADLKELQARLNALERANQERKDSQIGYAQEMARGAKESLDRQPDEHKTEQTELAVQFLDRTELGLALAIGRLPESQQQQIVTLVDKALSKYAADRDEARRLLQKKDAELQQVTRERDAIKAEIPKIEAKVAAAEEKSKTKEEKLAKAETKLSVWATLKDRADRHASSLAGQVESLWNGFLWLAAAYIVIVFILPGIVKYLPSGALKTVLRDTSGFVANPLLHWDARRKLDELKKAAAK